MKRHPANRPWGPAVNYIALENQCPYCGKRLAIYQDDRRRVQGLQHQYWLHRRDKKCSNKQCSGPHPLYRAPRDLRICLPGRLYGLEVTLYVGERHLADGVSLAQITRDLNARGVPLDQRHTGRVFRDFVALTSLSVGDDKALIAKLRKQGGLVLMVDGVQFENRSPVLYVVWDAISGAPLFGERKLYRGADDLIPLLEGVRDLDVPVIGVVTDKEKALISAVQQVLPEVPYQFCHTHFLRNCGKTVLGDASELGDGVRKRAEQVRKIGKRVAKKKTSQQSELPPAKDDPEPCDNTTSSLSEEELLKELCALVRANSRVSGKWPLGPAELNRHDRLEQIRSTVVVLLTRQTGDGSNWKLLDQLYKALTPTWHEAQAAGRIRRHVEILRELSRLLSTDPLRPDLPSSAEEARQRFEAYLNQLVASTPKTGMASPTWHFVQDLFTRYERYADHLFICFDEPRIPASTNALEGFFGSAKQLARRTTGARNTMNTVITNLGADAILAFHHLRQDETMENLANPTYSAAEFLREREALATREAPAIRQRSMVRSLKPRLNDLSDRWLSKPGPDG